MDGASLQFLDRMVELPLCSETGAVLGQGDMPVVVTSGALVRQHRNCGFSAVAVLRRSSSSLSWRICRFLWF